MTYLLAVDGDGLRLVDRQSGATRPLAFETPAAQVLAALENLRGAPAQQGRSEDCAAGYASWNDGLNLTFQHDRFVGWFMDARTAGAITTISGIGAGSTRQELDSAYHIQVRSTSLGTEFTAGALAGLLSGTAPTDTITHMWSGVTCIAR
jgi:hypothetical protein